MRNDSKILFVHIATSIALSGGMASCKVAGHRTSTQSGSELAASAGEACSEAALESLIRRLGVIEALAADESECLDSDKTAIAAPVEPLQDTKTTGESFGLTDAPNHRLRLQVVIGWQVINDLLNNVAQDAVNGTNRGGHTAADIARLREQVTRGFDGMRPALVYLKASAQADVVYSYSDLYITVKSRFVDPLVYGYSGPLHRIVHRRYSRGRGLVYRIATQKLAEALYKFHGVAQRELAGFSDSSLGVNVVRFDGSLATSENIFLSLYYNQKLVGQPVSYVQAKELAQIAQREIPALINSPVGQAVGNYVRPEAHQ